MAQQGQEQGAGMSDEEFRGLLTNASEGKTAEVLAAVDQDRRLATRADGGGDTLLICAFYSDHDNPQLAQGLLERGANVHARANDGWNALMCASRKGHMQSAQSSLIAELTLIPTIKLTAPFLGQLASIISRCACCLSPAEPI